MAQTTMFRINQIAKDFGLKNKDVLSVLESRKIGGKSTQSTLEPGEFSVLLDALTLGSQIKGLDAYLSGKALIPNPNPVKKEKKPAEEKKKPAESAPKKETPAAETKPKPAAPEAPKGPHQYKIPVGAQTKNAPNARTAAPQGRYDPRQNARPGTTPTRTPGQAPARRTPGSESARAPQTRTPVPAYKPTPKAPNNRFADRDFFAEGGKQKAKTQGPVSERKRTGNTRVVDTRTSSVDLSKYDDRLNVYETDDRSSGSSRQKLTKQNGRDNRSAKSRDKERFAMDKLKQQNEAKKKVQLKVSIPDEI
ncbi:MAG: hypothetical protein II797_00355, partial [Clostridia bacterium]|nr:hypothetical protein [Clostridia bacterium]